MVASQNFCGGTKYPAADNNKLSKKVVTKVKPKKVFFTIKSQTSASI